MDSLLKWPGNIVDIQNTSDCTGMLKAQPLLLLFTLNNNDEMFRLHWCMYDGCIKLSWSQSDFAIKVTPN